jgi:cell division protein FtsQ
MPAEVRVIRAGKPIDGRPALRYMRNRANRRVRKARLTRTILRRSALVAAHLGIAAVALFAATRLIVLVAGAGEFALERIEIEGARRAAPDAVQARLAPYLGRNLLALDMSEVAATAASDPWVLWASARRVFPDTVRLQIEERRPSATAIIGGIAHVIDPSGYVIAPCGPGAEDDLPVLTGVDGLTETALIAELARGAGIVERLRRTLPSWTDEISEIDLATTDRVAVRSVDPGPIVLLDPGRVERNVAEYLELRHDIVRRVGPLSVVDLRWQDRVTVTPQEPIAPKEDS